MYYYNKGLSLILNWDENINKCIINSRTKKIIADMKEYMFSVLNKQNGKARMPAEDHLSFVKSCEQYILQLKQEGKLIAAQPMHGEKTRVSKNMSGSDAASSPTDELVQVGYYHIRANDLEEAKQIALQNQEFDFVSSAVVDIQEIKTKEVTTGFEYPVPEI
jgi:hypothetical protein